MRAMKYIAIQHRLGGYTSHHFNETYGFLEELGRRGTKFLPLVSIHAPRQIVGRLRARAVFDDPTFRMEWSFEERSARFVEMLHRHVDRLVRRDDRILVTVATQLEADALTRWLARLPQRKKPWVIVLFMSDRWNRSGPEERSRQLGEFATLRTAVAARSVDDARRQIYCTLTEQLAAELTGLLGTEVVSAPIPLPYHEPAPHDQVRPRDSPPLVAVLGGLRREKGSYLLPEIIRACRPLVRVEFLVHLMNNTLSPPEVETVAAIAREPGVRTLEGAIPMDGYHAAVERADIGLFPYEVVPYRQRTSGVFAEMVAAGKPVIATAGTWMAEQIEAGRAAGAIADELRPEPFARAIAACVAALAPLRQQAQSASAEWRRTVSMPAFVDFVEAQIAAREPHLSQRRRFLSRATWRWWW